VLEKSLVVTVKSQIRFNIRSNRRLCK